MGAPVYATPPSDGGFHTGPREGLGAPGQAAEDSIDNQGLGVRGPASNPPVVLSRRDPT